MGVVDEAVEDGVEGVETPIVEDQELGGVEAAHDAGITPVAMRQREIGEEFGDGVIEHRAVVAAGLVAEGTGKPTLADSGRPAQDQIVVGVDPSPPASLWNRARSRPRGAR
jgi:hypothetical protein